LSITRDLLLRAESDLRLAALDIDSKDEYDTCLVAFHIQQAVEKILKVCLKEFGIDYTKTHKIEELLALLLEG